MRRTLLTIALVLSLLPCAAICVLWAQSYRVARIAFWERSQIEWQAAASRGSFWVFRKFDPNPPPPLSSWAPANPAFHVESYRPPQEPRMWGYGPPGMPIAFDRAGVAAGWGPYATVQGWTCGVVILPGWLAFLLTLIPPTWAIRRWRARRQRDRAGLCPHCGYDLRATPDRCPECGRAGGAPVLIGR